MDARASAACSRATARKMCHFNVVMPKQEQAYLKCIIYARIGLIDIRSSPQALPRLFVSSCFAVFR